MTQFPEYQNGSQYNDSNPMFSTNNLTSIRSEREDAPSFWTNSILTTPDPPPPQSLRIPITKFHSAHTLAQPPIPPNLPHVPRPPLSGVCSPLSPSRTSRNSPHLGLSTRLHDPHFVPPPPSDDGAFCMPQPPCGLGPQFKFTPHLPIWQSARFGDRGNLSGSASNLSELSSKTQLPTSVTPRALTHNRAAGGSPEGESLYVGGDQPFLPNESFTSRPLQEESKWFPLSLSSEAYSPCSSRANSLDFHSLSSRANIPTRKAASNSSFADRNINTSPTNMQQRREGFSRFRDLTTRRIGPIAEDDEDFNLQGTGVGAHGLLARSKMNLPLLDIETVRRKESRNAAARLASAMTHPDSAGCIATLSSRSTATSLSSQHEKDGRDTGRSTKSVSSMQGTPRTQGYNFVAIDPISSSALTRFYSCDRLPNHSPLFGRGPPFDRSNGASPLRVGSTFGSPNVRSMDASVQTPRNNMSASSAKPSTLKEVHVILHDPPKTAITGPDFSTCVTKFGAPGPVKCFVPMDSQLTGEDVALVLFAVQSLYADRLHPTLGMLQQRLTEKISAEHDVSPAEAENHSVVMNFLDVVRSNPSMLTLEEHPTRDEKVMIRLRDEPRLSEGDGHFIDAMSSDDPFSLDEWSAFFSYFYERMRAINFRKKDRDCAKADQLVYQHRGGRYGLGVAISKAHIDGLGHLCVGHLCHMVQLARDRGVLVYEANVMEMRCGSLQSSEIFSGRLPSTKSCRRNRLLWSRLQHLLTRLVDPYAKGALLANLKKDLRERMGFGFAIQEFGYKSLSALLSSDPLNGRYTLWQDGRGGVYCVHSKYRATVTKQLRPFVEKRKDGAWPADRPFWNLERMENRGVSFHSWSEFYGVSQCCDYEEHSEHWDVQDRSSMLNLVTKPTRVAALFYDLFVYGREPFESNFDEEGYHASPRSFDQGVYLPSSKSTSKAPDVPADTPFTCYFHSRNPSLELSLPATLPPMIAKRDEGPRQLAEHRFSTMEFQKFLLRVAESGVDERRECWALYEEADFRRALEISCTGSGGMGTNADSEAQTGNENFTNIVAPNPCVYSSSGMPIANFPLDISASAAASGKIDRLSSNTKDFSPNLPPQSTPVVNSTTSPTPKVLGSQYNRHFFTMGSEVNGKSAMSMMSSGNGGFLGPFGHNPTQFPAPPLPADSPCNFHEAWMSGGAGGGRGSGTNNQGIINLVNPAVAPLPCLLVG